nr:unnamed protein product [Digitaria exilis]
MDLELPPPDPCAAPRTAPVRCHEGACLHTAPAAAQADHAAGLLAEELRLEDSHLAVDQLMLGLLEDSQISDYLKEAGVSAAVSPRSSAAGRATALSPRPGTPTSST